MVHVRLIRIGLVVVAVGAVGGVGGAIALAGAAALAAGERDYSALPPKAADLEAMLRKQGIDLAGALDVACNEVGGVIASASFDLERSAEWVEVVVFAKGSKHRLVIDAISGRVASDEIVDGEWTELPSGLKYFDIVVGEGAQPAGPTSTVTVHYTGWLVDGKKFDSSFDRGQPATFQLGRVIPGWTEGVG
ncbi:MAG: FKBP-type peptidyl-prolyl cis-trans isomerase, partial [Planctomycetota bacterium]